MVAPISRDELRTAMAEGRVVVLDTLGGQYYETQHLPGAHPLVLDDVDAQVRALVPDPATPVVTYCSDETCPNSTRVAMRLEQLGYTSVRKYAGGIADWLAAGLPVESGAPVTA